MDINGLFVVIFLLMIVADSSNASFAWNFRKLSGAVPNINSSISGQNSSLPSPISTMKESDSRPVDDGKKSGKENSNDTVKSLGSNNNNKTGSATIGKQIDKEKGHEVAQKGENTNHSQSGTSGSCQGSLKSCREKTMLACIQNSGNGSKELILLVKNEGEITLKVNLSIPTSVDYALPPFEIPSRKMKKINITFTVGKSIKIVLNTGIGDCELLMDRPESEKNFLKQLSFYSKQVTPIYGAYFLFLVALVFGGIWGCCNLRKRRLEGGVPYQELEMGLPESSAAASVDTTEGWDQDWDDDWDEDNAVKSPGGRHVGSVSGNGLTSRSSKRDGWEADWDN